MDLLDLLEAAHREGRQASVRWSYRKGNDRALEMIEEFKEEVVALPFFVVPVDADAAAHAPRPMDAAIDDQPRMNKFERAGGAAQRSRAGGKPAGATVR